MNDILLSIARSVASAQQSCVDALSVLPATTTQQHSPVSVAAAAEPELVERAKAAEGLQMCLLLGVVCAVAGYWKWLSDCAVVFWL